MQHDRALVLHLVRDIRIPVVLSCTPIACVQKHSQQKPAEAQAAAAQSAPNGSERATSSSIHALKAAAKGTVPVQRTALQTSAVLASAANHQQKRKHSSDAAHVSHPAANDDQEDDQTQDKRARIAPEEPEHAQSTTPENRQPEEAAFTVARDPFKVVDGLAVPLISGQKLLRCRACRYDACLSRRSSLPVTFGPILLTVRLLPRTVEPPILVAGVHHCWDLEEYFVRCPGTGAIVRVLQ